MNRYDAIGQMGRRIRHAEQMRDVFQRDLGRIDNNEAQTAYAFRKLTKWSYRLRIRTVALARLREGIYS